MQCEGLTFDLDRLPSAAMHAYILWLVSMMMAWAPPQCAKGESPRVDHCRAYRTYPEAVETREETAARYASIAEAAVDAAFDPNEDVLVSGMHARERTVLILLSVAFYESGFRRDVDLNLGPRARGDSSTSWSIWQIRLDKHGASFTPEGWTGPDLIADRSKAARAALHKLRHGVRVCSGSLADRIAIYRWGRCHEADPNDQARIDLAERWFPRSQGHAVQLQ